MKTRDRFSALLIVRLDLLGVAGLPRLLHAAGCEVTLFAPARVAVAHSRFLRRHLVASPSSEALIEELAAHLATHRREYDWIILGDETLLQEIAEKKRGSWLADWFPVDYQSRSVELITSKFDFLQAAADAGLPVPRFRFCRTAEEARRLADEFGFPLILKQPTSMAGSGVRKVWGHGDLALQFAQISGGESVMVQQCALGRRGQTEVLFDRGRPVCWESSYTVRSWPTELAASCVRELMTHPGIEPMLQGIGELTGFHGLGGVDWMHDPETGALSLIEFNARPTPGCYSMQMFADSVRESLAGVAVVHRPSSSLAGLKIHMFPQSVYQAIDDRNPGMLLRACANLPFSDPGLLLALFQRVIGHYVPPRARQRIKEWAGAASGATTILGTLG